VIALAGAFPDRYRALIPFGAGTGVRISEALGLTPRFGWPHLAMGSSGLGSFDLHRPEDWASLRGLHELAVDGHGAAQWTDLHQQAR
jgi:hypothetical protein